MCADFQVIVQYVTRCDAGTATHRCLIFIAFRETTYCKTGTKVSASTARAFRVQTTVLTVIATHRSPQLGAWQDGAKAMLKLKLGGRQPSARNGSATNTKGRPDSRVVQYDTYKALATLAVSVWRSATASARGWEALRPDQRTCR